MLAVDSTTKGGSDHYLKTMEILLVLLLVGNQAASVLHLVQDDDFKMQDRTAVARSAAWGFDSFFEVVAKLPVHSAKVCVVNPLLSVILVWQLSSINAIKLIFGCCKSPLLIWMGTGVG